MNLIRIRPKTRTPRMYILTRLDLAESYRMVQGSHALAQYALEHNSNFRSWKNGTVVFLGVRNLIALRGWTRVLKIEGKCHSVFYEPDLDYQETSIACWDDGDIFKTLKTV